MVTTVFLLTEAPEVRVSEPTETEIVAVSVSAKVTEHVGVVAVITIWNSLVTLVSPTVMVATRVMF